MVFYFEPRGYDATTGDYLIYMVRTHGERVQGKGAGRGSVSFGAGRDALRTVCVSFQARPLARAFVRAERLSLGAPCARNTARRTFRPSPLISSLPPFLSPSVSLPGACVACVFLCVSYSFPFPTFPIPCFLFPFPFSLG